jgi:hypothetical protein
MEADWIWGDMWRLDTPDRSPEFRDPSRVSSFDLSDVDGRK